MDELTNTVINASSSSSRFHNATKLKRFIKRDDKAHSTPILWKVNTYKAYPRFQQVILPVPTQRNGSLVELLTHRRSVRNFTAKNISLKDLSNLIYYSVGSTKFFQPNVGDQRMYPSAGGRYPLEVYPFVFHAEPIPIGGYHYHVKTHSLEKILDGSYAKRVFSYFDQEWLRQSSVLFVITAIFNRTEIKYGDRGYRHILTEYGHVAQNLYLLSQLYGIGCCSIGGFIDNGINRLLDLDFEDEAVVGVVAVGNKAQRS